MHFHSHQHRCARGPGRGDWGRWGGGGGRWGHGPGQGLGGDPGERGHWRRGGGMARVFEQGDLRFVVLALLAEQPRHGYDIIKEIETRAGGAYSPSPGVIYPLLSMLEEMGLIAMSPGEGGKKLYAVTDEGKARLEAEKEVVEALFERIAAVRARFADGRAPQIIRAMENLKMALRLRIESGGLSEEQVSEIAAALDAAASAIEKTNKP